MKKTAYPHTIQKALANLTENEIYTFSELKQFVSDFWCNQFFVSYNDLENVVQELTTKRNDWLCSITINNIRYFWIEYSVLAENRKKAELKRTLPKIMVNGVMKAI